MGKKEVYFGFFNIRCRAVKNLVYPLPNLAQSEFLLVLIKNSEAVVSRMNLPQFGSHQSIANFFSYSPLSQGLVGSKT
jgi:hypothetical protein